MKISKDAQNIIEFYTQVEDPKYAKRSQNEGSTAVKSWRHSQSASAQLGGGEVLSEVCFYPARIEIPSEVPSLTPSVQIFP